MSWRWWWEHPAKLRTVIVNLKQSDEAIRGVLWSNRGAWIVLKDAYLLVEQKEPMKMDGEVIIERTNVAFYQVLP